MDWILSFGNAWLLTLFFMPLIFLRLASTIDFICGFLHLSGDDCAPERTMQPIPGWLEISKIWRDTPSQTGKDNQNSPKPQELFLEAGIVLAAALVLCGAVDLVLTVLGVPQPY